MIGDIGNILTELDGQLGESVSLDIDCTYLLRVDFIAAGDLLNWVLARRAEDRAVNFINPHRLVALFFGAMGHQRARTRQIAVGLRGLKPRCQTSSGSKSTATPTQRVPQHGFIPRHDDRQRSPANAHRLGSRHGWAAMASHLPGPHRGQGQCRKVRKLYREQVLAGFAGATADAFTLLNALKPNWRNTRAIWPELPLN